MLTPDQISELPLHWVEKWPMRKIARHLRIGRRTIAKYLDVPSPKKVRRERTLKIDSWKEAINELLLQDQDANAPVIAQRLSRWDTMAGSPSSRTICGSCERTPWPAALTFVSNPHPANG